jgi:hopene-associated glycosyltransferase HpnB
MTAVALLSFCAWAYLFFAHGKFWSSKPQLLPAIPAERPAVDIVVPARDEAHTIGPVIASLLAQDYAGTFRVILVDDDSTDGTARCAGTAPNLVVIRGQQKPPEWSGKLWALNQGVEAGDASILFFTDADIVHDPRHLSTLMARLPELDMVSEMVQLNCTSLAERALVPAFVYFFQMLYPFAKVNDARSRVAAAAGGTVLIRREALQRIGGIDAIKGALIDDVSLAKAVKVRGRGAIYLGHSVLAASIRPYPHYADMWRMISRTAFTQLRRSAVLLVLTTVALTLVWLVPIWALLLGHGWERAYGAAACALAAISYVPTLRRYERSPLWALALPLIALFYMSATVGSALDHWRGAGSRWKNRAYGGG